MGLLGKSDKLEATKPSSTSEVKPAIDNKNAIKNVSQKDAVFAEVKRLIKDKNLVVSKGTPVSLILNADHRQEIVSALVLGFRNKKYFLKETESNKKKLEDEKLLKNYVTGLLKNWLERDKRLKNENGEFLLG